MQCRKPIGRYAQQPAYGRDPIDGSRVERNPGSYGSANVKIVFVAITVTYCVPLTSYVSGLD